MPNKENHFDNNVTNESIRFIASPSVIAKRSFLYILEIGYLEDDFSYLQELDDFENYMLCYTILGGGKLRYDGNEYELKKDDLFLIDCKKYYFCSTDNPKEWQMDYIYFNGAQAKDYYEMIIKNGSPIIRLDNPKTITSLFWQIVGLYKRKTNLSEMLTSLHLTRILTELALLNADTSAMETENPDFLNEMFYYIKRHYQEKITLDMLAERYSINKYHLAKVFKRYAGTTINEYVITNRMDRAKALLRYTDKSVEEIANEVGFYNASHFIKMFREREHVTPLFYRKLFAKIK